MDKLINGIEPALTKLSETFCVSIDTIREHGMEYIMMYGKYHYIHSMVMDMFFMFVIGVLLTALVLTLTYWFFEEQICSERSERISITVSAVFFIIFMVAAFIFSSLSYWICPEMYSINAVMELIQ